MSEPTLIAAIVSEAQSDHRLSHAEKNALLVLWQPRHLSAFEYRPMKAESLGSLLRVKRPSAARILRRLVQLGYLDQHVPSAHNKPRQFLLLNVRRDKAA